MLFFFGKFCDFVAKELKDNRKFGFNSSVPILSRIPTIFLDLLYDKNWKLNILLKTKFYQKKLDPLWPIWPNLPFLWPIAAKWCLGFNFRPRTKINTSLDLWDDFEQCCGSGISIFYVFILFKKKTKKKKNLHFFENFWKIIFIFFHHQYVPRTSLNLKKK